MNKKIKGLTLLAVIVMTSTPLDLFSKGGHSGGGGAHHGSTHSIGGGRFGNARAGGGRSAHSTSAHNHNGNGNGNHNWNGNHGWGGRGWGGGYGWAWGGFATGLIIGGSLIAWSDINTHNCDGYYKSLQQQIDDLNTQLADAKEKAQNDKIDKLQKDLDDTHTQIKQLQAFKDAGFPSKDGTSEQTDVSKKIDKMENELAALKAENAEA